MRFYKYLYYRIYNWQLKLWGESEGPEFTALLGVSFLLFLNIYGVLLLIDYLTGFSIIRFLQIGSLKISLGILLIIGFNYLLFIRGNNFEAIARDFKGEDESQSRVKLIFIFLYIFLSFFMIISIAKLSEVGQVTFIMR